MKTNIVFILALSVILTACSSTKKNSTNTTDKSIVQNESTNTISTTGIQNTSKKLNDEYATMFAKLEMSKEQISTFTSEMNRFKNKQANTASGEMLGSIESERTRQLENILSSSQYAKYEQWLAENE
ncbi:hypothetical protein PXD56_12965 [Maribacter sp. SA7]|uniref:hypothetical protein n=1 Tax=Maribacter zhoushanensis TaxID=3030012 RepID=UPI0023EC0D63|nr:hypothetical protein [Maribacter zhoushanensis]MDF4203877.1 hypothetical protein [Maribacter zhoushanensis]